MNIELNNTFSHEMGRNHGAEICHKTLSAPDKTRELTIMKDMFQIINDIGYGGATIKQQLPLSRLVGYIEALAKAVGMVEAFGVTFSTRLNRDGTEYLVAHIDYPTPRALNSHFSKSN